MSLGVAFAVALALQPQADDPGERAFQRCVACHTLDESPDAAGPPLRGVVGRRAGSVQGWVFSDALRQAGREGLVWTPEALDRLLRDPEAMVPGTSMPYQGGTAAERRAVIDWLSRQGHR